MIPKPVGEISADDIRALIGRVEEGVSLDFKRDLPGDDRDARKEFIADVCALANTSGGDLLYGVDEDAEGCASAIVPVAMNPDEVITKLSNVLADSLEPRLHGIAMKAVQVDAGEHVLVVRVPRSLVGVHRSARDGHFWIRESRSKRQMDVAGIGNRFRDHFGREDRIAEFFARRYAAIGANQYPLTLQEGPKVVVHIVPARDFLSGEQEDLSSLSMPSQFPVMAQQHSADASMCSEGVLHHTPLRDEGLRAATLLFRSGVVEGVGALEARSAEAPIQIPLERTEGYVFDFLRHALPLTVTHLTRGWPVLVRVAIVGAHLGVGRTQDETLRFNIDGPSPVRVHGFVLSLPEMFIESDPGQSLPRLLRLPFDRLWQAWGYKRAYSYQEREGQLTWRRALI